MFYKVTPAVRIDVGQFKSPFSYEFLTPSQSIDFVNRSQVVTALAPGRQLGAQIGFEWSEGRYGARVGVFNGNGTRRYHRPCVRAGGRGSP